MPEQSRGQQTSSTGGLAGILREIAEPRVQDAWFRWLERVTITAAIYAFGRKGGSPLLLLVAYACELMLVLTAYPHVERFIVRHAPKDVDEHHRPALFWAIVWLIAIIPAALALFMASVFSAVIR